MNYGMFTGVLCTIPSVAIIPIGERDEIFICKFVLCTSENVDGNMQYDFFECVAFERLKISPLKTPIIQHISRILYWPNMSNSEIM